MDKTDGKRAYSSHYPAPLVKRPVASHTTTSSHASSQSVSSRPTALPPAAGRSWAQVAAGVAGRADALAPSSRIAQRQAAVETKNAGAKPAVETAQTSVSKAVPPATHSAVETKSGPATTSAEPALKLPDFGQLLAASLLDKDDAACWETFRQLGMSLRSAASGEGDRTALPASVLGPRKRAGAPGDLAGRHEASLPRRRRVLSFALSPVRAVRLRRAPCWRASGRPRPARGRQGTA